MPEKEEHIYVNRPTESFLSIKYKNSVNFIKKTMSNYTYKEIYHKVHSQYMARHVSDDDLIRKIVDCKNRLKGKDKITFLSIFYSLVFFAMKSDERDYNDNHFCVRRRSGKKIPVEKMDPFAKGIVFTFLEMYEEGNI